MAILLSGTKVAAEMKEKICKEMKVLSSESRPGLAVILVGADAASQIYVRKKEEDCKAVGFQSRVIYLPAETSEQALLAEIQALNTDEAIDGILVQLPLPPHISEKAVIYAIDPEKDVDGFHPINVGRVALSQGGYRPCTPEGVIVLLKAYGVEMTGKNAVIIGRSNIVGKPMATLLLAEDATVTICHSKTKGLAKICREADILVAAVGVSNFVTADMVKNGAVVVDVGMNRDEKGKLTGDVLFEEVSKKASYITPVPGGVGPMTRAILLENTKLAKKSHSYVKSN